MRVKRKAVDNKILTNRKAAARTQAVAVVVLAAGRGTRMKSDRAKVLHELAGKPMLLHVLDTAGTLRPERIVVVVGHQGGEVSRVVGDSARCVVQEPQLGTGHAVMQAASALRGFRGEVLVLCGDVPLLRAKTLRGLLSAHRRRGALASVLSMTVEDPSGYGRIVRSADSAALRIVEDADADPAQQHIDEVNSGIYCFDAAFLWRSLRGLGRDNAQGEYYLTDVIEAASARNAAYCRMIDDAGEGIGINSRFDLAVAEALTQDRLLSKWMDRGVTFLDPGAAYLSAGVHIGRDTVIGPNVRLEGATRIGKGCVLDGCSYLRDTVVGSAVHVRWGVVADSARIASGVNIGPYAHLRPEARLDEDVHVGNFVEVKKSRLRRGVKANHLSYIGDAEVGEGSNIGAGTITCNYDGVRKYRSSIGKRVQIGSDTQLVAPVKIGDDAYIAAGSTITSDVAAGALAFNDKRQKVREGWVAAFKRRSGRATDSKS